MFYNPSFSEYRYKSVKLNLLLFCFIFPIFLIFTFFIFIESYLQIALAIFTALYYISFFGVRKKVEGMRYFSIMTEISVLTFMMGYIIFNYSFEILFGGLMYFVASMGNLLFLFDKNIYVQAVDDENAKIN